MIVISSIVFASNNSGLCMGLASMHMEPFHHCLSRELPTVYGGAYMCVGGCVWVDGCGGGREGEREGHY